MRFFILFIITILFTASNAAFALSCKQSEPAPLASAHEQTEILAKQFIRIDHIETLPQKIIPSKTGFLIDTVQVLICGELLPQITFPASSGQACQFDSQCAKPMSCQNNLCK